MAKRRHKVRVDRISEMPHLILQQILSRLSQEEAVRTCVLSKSWRLHWSTLPIVEFRQQRFNRQTFESDVNKTLQRYLEQHLSIHVFRLQLSTTPDSEPAAEVLRKWIPKLKIFNIYLLRDGYNGFSDKSDIPSSVLKAESLQKLYLEGQWTVDQKCVANVLCEHLKTLHLEEVGIADETLKKIISRCPLIENVTLKHCRGLRETIKVDDKLHNLKHFECETYEEIGTPPSIEIDVPSSVIEKIIISGCRVWFRNEYQRNLKSLSLDSVRLSSEQFNFFSRDMPRLEFLELKNCSGFKEFHLSSCSINHFVFTKEYCKKEPNIRATIDAPNILFFKYSSSYLPAEFSFTTTNSSHEWKSEVSLEITDNLSWFLKLHQLLEELSGSKISMFLHKITHKRKQKTKDMLLLQDKQPVVVEHLDLCLLSHYVASRSDFMNHLFRLCHPRVIVGDKKTNDFLRKNLGKKGDYKWQQDLEGVSMETKDIDDSPRNLGHRFRLKWREI